MDGMFILQVLGVGATIGIPVFLGIRHYIVKFDRRLEKHMDASAEQFQKINMRIDDHIRSSNERIDKNYEIIIEMLKDRKSA